MNNWRLIIDQPKSGMENMAIDEAILISCNAGFSQSTIRLYDWIIPTLSIGCFQKTPNLIESCLKEDIPFVRRITGGRAVLHADEITYSIICNDREELFREGISGAYRMISECLLEALRDIEIDAVMHTSCSKEYTSLRSSCFHSPSKYEITIDGKKLIGSAQRRLKTAFLQHGSIMFGMDRELVSKLFGERALTKMVGISYYNNKVKKDNIRSILIDKIAKGLNIKVNHGSITESEGYIRDQIIRVKESEHQSVRVKTLTL